jgi:hypothetical protein
MTWTQTNTISWSGNSDTHAVNVYFFDTYLNGRANWTVTAHPDASGFKRSVKRTISNNPITGTSFEMYYWVDWSSVTSSTSTSWYNDATYTTVPQDLGTAADADRLIVTWTNGVSSANVIRFWQSDQNANAFLVTKGKYVMMWDPGIDNILCFEEGTWTGQYNNRSLVFPAGGGGFWRYNGLPYSRNATSPLASYITPAYGGNNVDFYPSDGQYIFMNTPYCYSRDRTDGAEESIPLSHEACADIGIHTDGTMSSTSRITYSSADGSLLYDGTNYYLRSNNNYTLGSIVFDMGTSEPTLT